MIYTENINAKLKVYRQCVHHSTSVSILSFFYIVTVTQALMIKFISYTKDVFLRVQTERQISTVKP